MLPHPCPACLPACMRAACMPRPPHAEQVQEGSFHARASLWPPPPVAQQLGAHQRDGRRACGLVQCTCCRHPAVCVSLAWGHGRSVPRCTCVKQLAVARSKIIGVFSQTCVRCRRVEGTGINRLLPACAHLWRVTVGPTGSSAPGRPMAAWGWQPCTAAGPGFLGRCRRGRPHDRAAAAAARAGLARRARRW